MAKFLLEDMVVKNNNREIKKEIKKEVEVKKVPIFEPKSELKAEPKIEIPKEVEKGPVFEPKRESPKEIDIKELREMWEGEVGGNTKNKSRYFLWIIAFISVAVFIFAVSFLFSKAEIIVNPKVKDIVLNENLSAVKDSSTDLAFRLMVVSDEESLPVKMSGEKDVNIKATGTVILYNSFSSAPQKLDIDTRLEASNGKIYKTISKTIIPGMNKSGTPGQVEVGIYASIGGPSYNSDQPLDFTIIGFKGTSKYTKFKGRSKPGTTLMGGFTGKAPVVADADKLVAINSLKSTLKTKLLQKATDHPSDFILFNNATSISIDDTSATTVTSGATATMSLKGTLYGFLFNEKQLTKKIALNNIDKYDGSDVYISNMKSLVFKPNIKDGTSLDGVQNIDFNLSGSAKFVWNVDVNKFTNDLLGKSKKDFNQTLIKYPNIDSATLTLSPIWKLSIPDKTKNIKVIVNYPK